MSTQNKSVALVTGGNRGIGREIARQLAERGIAVVITARSSERAEAAAAALRGAGLDVTAAALEQSDADSVRALAEEVSRRHGRLDILVNNAGAAFDWTPTPTQPSQVALEIARRTFETNVFGPLALTQALLPLLRQSPAGRVVNLSSPIGSLAEIGRPDSPLSGIIAPMYQASKAALNAITALLAKELRGTSIKVNSASPGWADTEGGVPDWLRQAMGGSGGARPVAEGADTPVWLATLPADGPSGGFFQNRQPIPW
jgi:NAD(P)-dependent dehydrogenase (short-subunit alcohol dehydrogenase family)